MPKIKKLSSTIECPADNFNRAMTILDNKLQAYEELRLIRMKVETSGLTQPLYDFLDAHASMKQLFMGLPKHDPNCSVESNEVLNEIQCIDIAIEGLFADIKEALRKLFAAFWSYVLDWTDTNRRLMFRLKRHKVALENNRNRYASDDVLKNVTGVVYNYSSEWLKLHDAVNDVATALGTLTANDVPGFLKSKKSVIAAAFAKFGTSLTDGGIIDDTPMFTKQSRKVGVGGAGWTHSAMRDAIQKAMTLLNKEEVNRGYFNAIRRAFDNAMKGVDTVNDVASMKMLVAVCKRNKIYASTVARAVKDVCVIALNHAND